MGQTGHPITVVLVDDHKIVRDALSRLLAEHGDIEVVGFASSGPHAIDAALEARPDVVVIDVGNPESGGVEAIRTIRDELPDTRAIALSTHPNSSYVSAAIEAGATGFVLKDAAFDELAPAIRRVSENLQYVSSEVRPLDSAATLAGLTGTEHAEHAHVSRVSVLLELLESCDPFTASHQRRVARLASAIAAEMNLADSQVDAIRRAALMHDVGKVIVPVKILAKPGQLSQVEFELVRSHAIAGYGIAESTAPESPLSDMIYQHHERCDGSGYPRGLTGAETLVEAKILAVADVVEAMSSHRPHRPSLGVDAALEEIEHGSGALYDPPVVSACTLLFKERGFQFSTSAA